MNVNMRSIVVALVALLPSSRLKNVALRQMGWVVGRDVVMGPCLVIHLDDVQIGDGVNIGPFNVFRGLARLELGKDVRLGQWNWISASLHMRQLGGPGQLRIGAQSALTSRHYVDCTGGVRVGAYTTIAGERSTFLTHGISWVSSDQTFRPIEIGEFCLLSSNVQVAPGAVVGDRVVVGMGATISGDLLEPGLYVQPRATLVKPNLAGQYFERQQGHVDSVQPRP
jgi:acetyltransferase-like isoleucine patch superfamily enzyme